MGPQATVLLMQKVIDAVPAQDDADHIPLIVHQNPAVPSRIKALIDGTGPSPVPVLRRMVRDLESAGAQALAMPCNTAHVYTAEICGATELPFLDMLAATALALVDKGRIGILASPATRLTGIFDSYLPGSHHTPEDDGPVLEMIRAVKAGAPASRISAPLEQEARRLLDHCDHILIACTELSLAAPLLSEDIPWTDSLNCLTAQIVSFAAPTARMNAAQ
jgi:aspartate racemase